MTDPTLTAAQLDEIERKLDTAGGGNRKLIYANDGIYFLEVRALLSLALRGLEAEEELAAARRLATQDNAVLRAAEKLAEAVRAETNDGLFPPDAGYVRLHRALEAFRAATSATKPTHGSPEIDEDARKLEALGADPGPTFADLERAPAATSDSVWADPQMRESLERMIDMHKRQPLATGRASTDDIARDLAAQVAALRRDVENGLIYETLSGLIGHIVSMRGTESTIGLRHLRDELDQRAKRPTGAGEAKGE